MKTHKCRIVIVKTQYQTPKSCPFDDMQVTLRELSRRTGFDAAYLSKIRAGKVAVTQETFDRLTAAMQEALV